ncbi:uncharacterized protein LOC111797246 [Cucurbita pepo subsp. pepo]|uniref:uncharacterized protein LOC111797246 n=1 Tax=Cucurbita pepo subsp. pepo TaxID=3664 RepID=UPI000C9D417C|nr:uncharacterized protein LOC111797246 [Cucurbita pepo subsp. pepo]
MLLGTFRSIVVHYSAGSSICAASKELKKAWSIHALEAAVILERLSSIVDNFNAHTIPIVIESDSSKIINLLNEGLPVGDSVAVVGYQFEVDSAVLNFCFAVATIVLVLPVIPSGPGLGYFIGPKRPWALRESGLK